MTNRCSRRAIACALLATTSLGSPAFAQAVPAPTFRQADSNGVDMVQGDLVTSITAGSIGSGSGELKLLHMLGNIGSSGSRGTSQWDHIYLNFISGNGTFVDFGVRDDKFPGAEARGATLSGGGANYQYTAPDGTVISFIDDQFGNNNETTTNLCTGIGDTNCFLFPNSVTSPDGKTVTLTYEWFTHCFTQTPPGQPRSINDPVHCDYTPRLKTVTNNEGYQIVFTYSNTQTGGVSPPANWWNRSTAALYNTTISTTTPQASISYAYPVSGEIDVTDTGGRLWKTTSSSTSVTIQRPGATSNTSAYNLSSGQVTSATIEGVTTNYSRIVSGTTATMTVTDPLGHSKIVTSDLNVGRPTSVQDELGRITTFQYDASGRLTQKTLPEGNSTQLAYDARGNVTQTTHVAKPGSGLSNIVTSASFDTTCTNPKTCDEPNSTTDAKGNVTNYTYDPTHGGVTSVTRPAAPNGISPQTRFSYASINGIYQLTGVSECQITSSCAGTSDETKVAITYDANYNLSSIARSDGTGTLTATTAMTYDPMGNLVTVDGPLAGTADTTKYRYDGARELIGVTSPDPDGAGPLQMRAIKYLYSPSGLLKTQQVGTVTDQSDAAWNNFAFAYQRDSVIDANDRVVRETLWDGTANQAIVDHVYDALGRPSCSITYMDMSRSYSPYATTCAPYQTNGSFGADRVSQTTYDAAGEVTQSNIAVGTSDAATERTLTYSNNGLVTSLTDGENNKTAYVFDGFDRLFQTQYPNTPKGAGTSNTNNYEQLSYDANGNVTSRRLRDGSSIGFTYDNLNRLTAKTVPTAASGVAGYTVNYGYDLLGRELTANFASSGLGITNTYDALSRRTSTSSNMTGTAQALSYQYDPAGQRTQLTYPDGHYLNYDHLVTGEVTAVRLNGATSGVGVIASFAYDNLGNRTSLTNGDGSSTSYGYDSVSRLASLQLSFAASANNLTRTFAYNPASQIMSTASSNDAYAWNGAANVNRPYSANGLNQYTAAGPATYAYDGNGNLTSDGSNSFVYDAENHMTSATVGGVASTLSYDPVGRLWRLQSGTTDNRYVYDGTDMVAVYSGSTVAIDYMFGPGIDEPIAGVVGGSVPDRWFHADERGSIIARTDSGGNVNLIQSYDEYGIPGTSNNTQFEYTGQLYLSQIGMYTYKARMYSPTLGRFMQTDPIGYGDGPNWYAYAHSDPVNGSDPLGTTECDANTTVCGHCTGGTVAVSAPGTPAGVVCVQTGDLRSLRTFNPNPPEIGPAASPSCPIFAKTCVPPPVSVPKPPLIHCNLAGAPRCPPPPPPPPPPRYPREPRDMTLMQEACFYLVTSAYKDDNTSLYDAMNFADLACGTNVGGNNPAAH